MALFLAGDNASNDILNGGVCATAIFEGRVSLEEGTGE